MKRIGFVDYKLENFHANVYLKILREDLKARGYEVSGAWSLDEASGKEWAAKNNVPYFTSPESLDKNCDFYVILAPSNPETHLELCKKFFRFGKTTYVDKTFAPDTRTAEKIFKIADKFGVKMQTSSALRYTNVQDAVKQSGGTGIVKHVVTWGGGSSFGEYAIHPVELAVSVMGPDAETLMRRGGGNLSQLLINFSGGRTAVVNVYANNSTPFAASVTDEKETKIINVDSSKIFVNLAAAVLDLFDTGKEGIDRAESLAIRRILDAAEKTAALKKFIKI